VGGALQTQASVQTDLKLGLDLTNHDDPRPYIDDSSRVEVTLRVASPDIDAQLSAGPLGVFVVDGKAALDKDGLGQLGQQDSSDPAIYAINLKDKANDKYFFDEALGLGQVQPSYQGKAEVRLPLYFPTKDVPLGGTANDANGDGYPDNMVVF